MKRYVSAAIFLYVMSVAFPSTLMAENEIQKLIDGAISGKEKKVILPGGVHRIRPGKSTDDYHLYVRNSSGLEIRGENTILVFENPKSGGIIFENCRGVTLSGVTVDWDPIPSPQGRIVSINPEGPWIDIQPDKGYLDNPDLFTKEGGAMIYDPGTRLLKRGTWDLFGARLSKEKDGILRMTFRNSNQVSSSGASTGDLLALRAKGGKMGVRLVNCAEMIVENVTIWSAPGMGLQELGGDGGNRYSNFSVTRGPAPENGPVRLLSSGADALHSSGVRKGPVIENCVLEYQGDDGIAIHGVYMLVAGGGDSDKVLVSPKYGMTYRAGDRLRIYDGRSFQLKKETKITAVEPGVMPSDTELVKKIWKQYGGDASNAKYFVLSVAETVKVEAGDLVSSPDWIGSGYQIRKNTIRHNRAQGMRIKAGDGVIEDNLIEGVMMAGIALGPEFATWLEGDYVQNTVIKNNTIRDVGLGAECVMHPRSIQVGAITVYAMNPERTYPSGKGNSGLVIEGNSIDNCGGIGMLLTCIKDSIIRNNTVGSTRILKTMEGGKVFGIDPDASIYVDEAENIKLEGNKTAGKGTVLGKNVKNVEVQ